MRIPAVLLLLLVATVGFDASAQQTSSGSAKDIALNYGFVSPNTSENLKLEQAIANVRSPEEADFLKRINSFRCVVQTRIVSLRALGSWSDGAENSAMLTVQTDEQTMRYLLSRIGKEARQKSVLYFHAEPNGAAMVYRLRPRKGMTNLSRLAMVLERSGISFRTLVPIKRNTIVYVVDLKRELYAKVRDSARRLNARLKVERGTAQFIGDDSSAERAQNIYAQEIADYEAKHPNLPGTCEAGQL